MNFVTGKVWLSNINYQLPRMFTSSHWIRAHNKLSLNEGSCGETEESKRPVVSGLHGTFLTMNSYPNWTLDSDTISWWLKVCNDLCQWKTHKQRNLDNWTPLGRWKFVMIICSWAEPSVSIPELDFLIAWDLHCWMWIWAYHLVAINLPCNNLSLNIFSNFVNMFL